MQFKILNALFVSAFLVFISCSKDDIEEAIKDQLEQTAAISTYTDIAFALEGNNDKYPIAFSVAEGRAFMFSELIQPENAAAVDIVAFANQAFIAFGSPSESNVPQGKVTKIQHTNVGVTAEAFDAMNVVALNALTNVNDNDSISASSSTDSIILFETSNGTKGAVKITAINSERILVDIKVAD